MHSNHSHPRGVALVLGTRPEMIKLAGIAQALGPRARLIHTGQHYSESLSDGVWHDTGLAQAEAVLGVGGRSRALQIGEALASIAVHFDEAPPAAVVVQGDTNAALAGALFANARDIPLVHVEAGLRSYDRAMPEEHNRVLIDHISDVLCAPTEINRANLLAENIASSRIVVTGNTVVEAVQRNLPGADETDTVVRSLGLTPDAYVLCTIHRPENTDDAAALRTILTELGSITSPVVLPLHPRTRLKVSEFGLDDLLTPLRVVEPLAPAAFLAVAARAGVIVSDSGGLQEECSVIKRPLLVVRRSTERPEVVGTFAERVTPGPEISRIVNGWLTDLEAVHAGLADTPSPYGDGSASARIFELIDDLTGGR